MRRQYIIREKNQNPLWSLPLSISPERRRKIIERIMKTAEEVARERAENPFDEQKFLREYKEPKKGDEC